MIEVEVRNDGHRTPPLFHPYSLHGENVAKAIDNEFLSKQSHFSVAELNGFLEFDSYRHLRMLCRHGFLLSVTEKSGLAEECFTALGQPFEVVRGGPGQLEQLRQQIFRFVK